MLNVLDAEKGIMLVNMVSAILLNNLSMILIIPSKEQNIKLIDSNLIFRNTLKRKKEKEIIMIY